MNNSVIKRGTGLLVIEAINSNPNGDPDRESDPRQRPDEHGEISPVSFKRKLRDLIEDKEGPVWEIIANELKLTSKKEGFDILEKRGRDRKQIQKEIDEGLFSKRYWDGRVFGNTFLEKESSNAIKTGAVQFGMGISVAPILVERLSTTNKAGVQEGKDRGMAPLAYRIVQHAVYCMPFFVNPSAAVKTGCTKEDIDLLLKVIPYAYPHTASYVRPSVEIRHAWYIEHKHVLGSCSDFALIDALTPRKTVGAAEEPSTSWSDYEIPKELPDELQSRVENLMDLMVVNNETAST